MQVAVLIFFLLYEFTPVRSELELCTKCLCYKKTLIQSLYTINCAQLELQHTFPDLKQWPQYSQEQATKMSVTFDRNNIKYLKKFPSIPGIVSLSLQHNGLTKIEGSAFAELENLKSLDLSFNQLTAEGVQADVFKGHYVAQSYNPLNIVVLNLGYNKLQSLSPFAFEHLPYLIELRLDNNPLDVLDPNIITALGSPNKLQVLDLAYTGLSDLPKTFVELPSIKDNLKTLYLNGNQFSKVPEVLGALGGSLHRLNLNDNPVIEFNEDSFRGLLMLQELNISAMPLLERIGPSTFTHLRNLENLYCSYNTKLTEVDEEAFQNGNFPENLKELHLKSNALHTLPENLAPWEKLLIVDIRDNPWRCDCELEWLVSELVPIIEEATPELVLQLHCSEPLQLSGISIMNLADSEYSESSCKHIDKLHFRGIRHRANVIFVALQALIIVIVLSSAAGLLSVYYVRLRRNVKRYKLLRPTSIQYLNL